MNPDLPGGWTVLQAGGSHGGGNQLLLDGTAGSPVLLKLYRRRGMAWREALKRLGYATVERRRGVTAEQRCELERATLALWREHGLDVPATLDRELPPGSRADTATWLEFCRGPLLSEVIADPEAGLPPKLELIERLAGISGRRHELALERNDPRFLMENGSVKHVIVCGERLVHFDFETGYHPRMDPLEALSLEVSTTLRSLARHGGRDFVALASAFVRGYPSRERLARIAEYGARSSGLVRRAKRTFDRRRRESGIAKTDMLVWLESATSSRASSSRSY